MSTNACNLLDEPLLQWRDGERKRHQSTLAGVLAALASGELGDFSRVRAHQHDAWGMFVTQLAGLALHRAGRDSPPVAANEWRQLLLSLTHSAAEPWCLVVDDLSRPAFFQPPVPERSITDWKTRQHPDELDMLVTTKAHDVKNSLISGLDAEMWVYALVTLQTMQGYPGRGYTRISRMNGGYGNRPRIGLTSNRSLSARFLRDLKVMNDSWQSLLERGFADDGCKLGWLLPWDGNQSLTMPELSPHFIEICSRVRCTDIDGGIVARFTTTTVRRCLPEIENGDVGDVWIPIERDKGALTVGASGFQYKLMSRLFVEGDFEHSSAQRSRPDDGEQSLLLASAMARGQGKTQGLHDRAVAVPVNVRRRLGVPESRQELARRATLLVQGAATMRSKVLYQALLKLAPDAKPFPDRFDARIDERYFDFLFDGVEVPEDEAQLKWEGFLRDVAWSELQRGIDKCCVPSQRWYSAVSSAEAIFGALLRKHFKTLCASTDKQAEGAIY